MPVTPRVRPVIDATPMFLPTSLRRESLIDRPTRHTLWQQLVSENDEICCCPLILYSVHVEAEVWGPPS